MSQQSDSEDQKSIIQAALDAAFPLIDQGNSNQTTLYNQIRSNPTLKNSPKKTIELLMQIILHINTSKIFKLNDSSSETIIHRLLCHLQSHVSLLEALSHNPELASLFLVGSSGSQSFSSFQKSILIEQASRLRFFLSQFKNSKFLIQDQISNYEKNLTLSSLNTLSEKLEELQSIKADVDSESYDFTKVKNAFKEVCSLLETSILFNDFLIQRKKGENFNDKTTNLQKELHEIKEQKEQIASQLYKVKAQLSAHAHNRSDKSKYRKTIEKLESDKLELIRQITELKESTISCKRNNERETSSMKTENRQLSSQIELLNQQVLNYQSMNDQKDEKIDLLKNSISEYSQKLESMHQLNTKQRKEVDDLKKIYQNVSNQLQTATDQLNEYRIQHEKLIKVNKKAAKENFELKSLLERANDANQKHLRDNASLIKQIRLNDDINPRDEIDKLKAKNQMLESKLCKAHKFINQLQEEIEFYKQQNSISNSKLKESSFSSQDKQNTRKHSDHKSFKTENFNQNFEEEFNEEEFILSKSLNDNEEESSLSKSLKNFEEETEDELDCEEESINAFLKHLSNEDKLNGLNEEDDIESILSSISNKSKKRLKNFEEEEEEEDKSSSKLHIGSSIMPSFDELERDIQTLERKVKKTRILVAENLK